MAASPLLARLIAARESWIECGRLGFKLRRPTEMELIRMRRGDRIELGLDAIRRCVADWKGVTEADLIPSGGDAAVPFDGELYGAWIEDHPELWQPISDRLYDLIEAHARTLESEQKN